MMNAPLLYTYHLLTRDHTLSPLLSSFYKSLLIPFCAGTHHESMKHMTRITRLPQQRLNLCVLTVLRRNIYINFPGTNTSSEPQTFTALSEFRQFSRPSSILYRRNQCSALTLPIYSNLLRLVND